MNRQHSFPAVVIAPLLLLVCLFPVQGLLAHILPGISGRATFDPSLTIFDIPIHLPFTIDLILVPGLFIVLYSIATLIYTSGLPVWQHLAQRLTAVFISVFLILFCVAIGALLSWLLVDHLPGQVRNGMKSLAVNADLHLPYAGYKTLPLHGDTFSLLGLVIGIVIGIAIMKKSPRARTTYQLTPEQRMTPYQRMLRDRRNGSTSPIQLNRTSSNHRRYEHSHGLCRSNPLPTFQPEAVNYRPLE
jgi:hypothetical protein